MDMHYLDYAATDIHPRFFGKDYMNIAYRNPNANYAEFERTTLLGCEQSIKSAIGVNGGHVLYFRTCSDSVRWLANQKIWGFVVSTLEAHDALWNNQQPYKCNGVTLSMLPYVSHLTGEIYNIIAEEQCDGVYRLLDCTQAIGKIVMDKNVLNSVDAISMSGHKIGCPELSFMWLSDRLCKRLGAHDDIRNQWGLVHGSLPVCGVLALTKAVEEAVNGAEDAVLHYFDARIRLTNRLEDADIKHDVIGNGAFAINAIYLPDILAEPLQTYLATKNIYIGIGGSACAEHRDYRVLNAMGYSSDEADHVIRVSFGKDTTEEDIDALVNEIKEFKQKFC